MNGPEDSANGFVSLAEHGVIDADFAVTLGAMARFRNRLVHLHRDVDDGQVQE